MSDDTETTCVACGLPTDERQSLPVSNGEVVGNDFEGEWGGVPACAGCVAVHAAGGPAALAAHVRVTRALRNTVSAARRALHQLARDADAAFDSIPSLPREA